MHCIGVSVVTTMNVSLPEEKTLGRRPEQDGRFGNSSEYLRELIRRDQERQARVLHIQKLIDEGLQSGIGESTMADLRQLARSGAKT